MPTLHAQHHAPAVTPDPLLAKPSFHPIFTADSGTLDRWYSSIRDVCLKHCNSIVDGSVDLDSEYLYSNFFDSREIAISVFDCLATPSPSTDLPIYDAFSLKDTFEMLLPSIRARVPAHDLEIFPPDIALEDLVEKNFNFKNRTFEDGMKWHLANLVASPLHDPQNGEARTRLRR